MADDAPLSAYEKQRAQNIASNAAQLIVVGGSAVECLAAHDLGLARPSLLAKSVQLLPEPTLEELAREMLQARIRGDALLQPRQRVILDVVALVLDGVVIPDDQYHHIGVLR